MHDGMETELFSLRGKHALISGGGTGIGLAIARTYSGAGAAVTLLGRREETLRAAAEELGPLAGFKVHDVTDTERNDALIESVDLHRPVDILVNNAGRHDKRVTLEAPESATREVLETNLTASLSLSRECAKRMVARGEGSILMILSMAAIFGIPQVAAYTASKAGVAGLVRQLAVEWGPLGVRVNGIAPGFIDTAMSRKALNGDPERKERVLRRTPLQRLGETAEVAAGAVYLASDAARFVTGAILPIDGGVSIGF